MGQQHSLYYLGAVQGGPGLQDQVLATVRGEVVEIISWIVFLFLGLAACGIAAMRRRSGVRVLVWLGIWSAMYGALRMGDSLAALARLPHWFQVSVPYLDTVIQYLILVVATRAWLELQLLSEISLWQPASTPQQDDITLLVLDIT